MKTGTRWLDVLSHGAVYLGIGLDLATVMRLTEDEKGLQIMLLRQQPRGLHIPRWQKVPLAVLGKVWINPNRPVGSFIVHPQLNFLARPV